MHPPTYDEADAGAKLLRDIDGLPTECFATWYPQMGGYTSLCLVVPGDMCVDVYIWHNGDFPFLGMDDMNNERQPVKLHHCDPGRFVNFGKFCDSVLDQKHADASST